MRRDGCVLQGDGTVGVELQRLLCRAKRMFATEASLPLQAQFRRAAVLMQREEISGRGSCFCARAVVLAVRKQWKAHGTKGCRQGVPAALVEPQLDSRTVHASIP